MEQETDISGWGVVQVFWAFLNLIFDHATPVMAEHGLHQKALVLLALLDHGDTPLELAQLLRTPPSSLSHLLKELEDKKLIRRTLDTNDKRKFHFTRTEEGEQAYHAGREAINTAVTLRIGILTEEEQTTLKKSLPLLMRLLEP